MCDIYLEDTFQCKKVNNNPSSHFQAHKTTEIAAYNNS